MGTFFAAGGLGLSGVSKPVGVLGASLVAGSHVAKGVLPFTGIALGIYVAVGTGFVLTGLVLRILGARRG